MKDALLLFLGRAEAFDGWMHLSDGDVAERGSGLDGLPPMVDARTGDRLRVVAVVPGEDVALHWVDLPLGLTPAQAAGAARLIAADLAAEPIEALHVAAGHEADGRRCIALTPMGSMSSWLARCQAAGLDPDIMLPEPLLLCPREGGLVRYDRPPLPLFRGAADAFSVESELAALSCPGMDVGTIDEAAFETGLAEAIAASPVNLRTGRFARARRWKLDWRLARRLGLLAAAILIVTAAVQLASTLRYTFAADAAEAEANQVAAAALPRGAGTADAPRQLERLVMQQGRGAGFGPLASALFDAVRMTPNAQLGGMVFEESAGLRVTLIADTPATVSALSERVRAAGLAVEAGPLKAQDGGQSAELRISAQ